MSADGGTYTFSLESGASTYAWGTRHGSTQVEPTEYKSVLVRRPSPPRVPDDWVCSDNQQFFLGEASALVDAVASLTDPKVLWVNAPGANKQASQKLLQLSVARRLGFLVPATLVTRDPSAAYDFYKRHHEQIVCKPLSATPVSTDSSYFLYTHVLSDSLTLGDFADVTLGSSLLQGFIEKRCDVRVAVVADRLFAFEILSQQDERAKVDWRAVPVGLEHRAIDVPERIRVALADLRRALKLQAMHVDFALDHDGRWWFLETNPNGQWLWLQLLTGAPIAAAFAELLAHKL
jgi:glutathione synthase/RimK-type ligase-like ATP-grasp enzyme